MSSGAYKYWDKFANDLSVTIVMVAGFEEALKLVGFAELRSVFRDPLREARRQGQLFLAGLIVLVIVAVPVGFWALDHGVEAYSNPWLIGSAFVNGLILLALLWKFGSYRLYLLMEAIMHLQLC